MENKNSKKQLHIFAERLNKLKGDKSLNEFSGLLGMQAGVVSRYLSALNSPRLEKLVQMSKVCNVTIDYLTGSDQDISTSNDTSIVYIPVVLSQMEGDGEIKTTGEKKGISLDLLRNYKKGLFMLLSDDNYYHICKGDNVIFDPECKIPENEKLYILQAGNKLIVRMVVISGKNIAYLLPDKETIVKSLNLSIIGKVITVINKC